MANNTLEGSLKRDEIASDIAPVRPNEMIDLPDALTETQPHNQEKTKTSKTKEVLQHINTQYCAGVVFGITERAHNAPGLTTMTKLAMLACEKPGALRKATGIAAYTLGVATAYADNIYNTVKNITE
ncbi:hypothetical protein GOV14_00465 [Candidatus Pacearchaeota archaeon]|nr:hypothetical protein [Candidatus Pacearchaeota archaeon]